jgi:adenylate cyclase
VTRTAAILGALCAAVVVLVSLVDETFLGAEWLLHDAFTRIIAKSRTPDPRIVIVAVSDQAIRSLEELYGRPPYSREVYAIAIDALRRAGVAIVVLDILFLEGDRDHPEGDRRLAQAVGTMPVVLAAQTAEKPPLPIAPQYVPKLWVLRSELPQRPMQLATPLSAFAGASGIGTIRIASSPRSSNVHAVPVIDPIGGNRGVGSLPAEIARVWMRLPRDVRSEGRALRIGSLRVPVNGRGEMAIRWNGFKSDPSALHYTSVGLDKLMLAALAHDDPSAVSPQTLATFEAPLRGKIVFIAYTASGLYDLRPTPLSPFAPGVEIHANALDNLINGDFNRSANHLLVFPLLIAISSGFGALIGRTRRQSIAGLMAFVAVAFVTLAGYSLLRAGITAPTVAAIAAILATYVVITVVKFTAEQKQTAVLRATFGRYVSPQILEHILAHPEKVQLGGERRDLTILFSDIRGFTSISEASEPEQVVEMLNDYLTRMVEILLDHGGTLDKFIGDAVMGFWNAPAADSQHARHAVQCAVAMIDETARLRERWESEGRPGLRIGIGINTGEAVVGNIGAEKVFGYTVIGDAVNLASRLEGKNKDYGTEIIISEFTKARIDDEFETVYLDEVKVKGKEQAVRIYEVKGKTHA